MARKKPKTPVTQERSRAERPRREMPWGDLPRGQAQEASASGLLVVDKDAGVTSHDIVGAVRRLAGTRKVGHAGTLDPMATGVLCVGIGTATRLLQYVTGTSKEYVATIRFGISTVSEDADGEIVEAPGAVFRFHDLGVASETRVGQEAPSCSEIEESRLLEAMAGLAGEIMQVPSAVSAVKIAGKRAYDLVREGHEVALNPRPVTIHAFDLRGEPRRAEAQNAEDARIPVVDIDVRVECSAGTYIRALARDLGAALDIPAHLTALRRTRVGAWSQAQAYSIAELAQRVNAGEPLPIVGLSDVCRGLFPVFDVSDDDARALRHGQFVRTPQGQWDGLAVAMADGEPVALVETHPSKEGFLKPSLVFPSAP